MVGAPPRRLSGSLAPGLLLPAVKNNDRPLLVDWWRPIEDGGKEFQGCPRGAGRDPFERALLWRRALTRSDLGLEWRAPARHDQLDEPSLRATMSDRASGARSKRHLHQITDCTRTLRMCHAGFVCPANGK